MATGQQKQYSFNQIIEEPEHEARKDAWAFKPMARKQMVEFKLYLGMTYLDEQGDLQEIDGEEIANFIETAITPVLPGYTLINALGAWAGIIEPTIIFCYLGQDEERLSIKNIAAAYKVRFKQEAVYMTETATEREVI